MIIAIQVLIVALFCFQSKPDTILSLSFFDPSGQPVQVTIDQQHSLPTVGSYVPNLREASAEGKIDVVSDGTKRKLRPPPDLVSVEPRLVSYANR